MTIIGPHGRREALPHDLDPSRQYCALAIDEPGGLWYYVVYAIHRTPDDWYVVVQAWRSERYPRTTQQAAHSAPTLAIAILTLESYYIERDCYVQIVELAA